MFRSATKKYGMKDAKALLLNHEDFHNTLLAMHP